MQTTVTNINTNLPCALRNWLVAVIMGVAIAICPFAMAYQQSGCYVGKDHHGYPAKAYVSVERYGDWFEIAGQIYSSGENRVYRFKADGHSGAGRLFQGHEYESGALYISVQSLTETNFVLQVESYGVFYFRRARC